MAVEVHHVIRAAPPPARRAALRTAGRRWPGAARPDPGPPSARPRRGPGGWPPTGTAHPPARPAGRSPAAPAAGPRPAPAAPAARPPASACGQTPPRPAPPAHPVPGSRSSSHASPGPSPGSASTSTRTSPSRSRARSQIPAASALANTRRNNSAPSLRQLRLGLPRDRRRGVGRELGVILQIPADPLPSRVTGRAANTASASRGSAASSRQATCTRRRPPGPAGTSLIRSSATMPTPR